MGIDEIKQVILESQKKNHHTILLLSELSLIKDSLVNVKDLIQKNQLSVISNLVKDYDLTSSRYFLHEQAYLYDTQLTASLVMLIHDLNRLEQTCELFTKELKNGSAVEYKKAAKDAGYDDPMYYVLDLINTRIENALSEMNEMEKTLDMIIPETVQMEIKKSSNLTSQNSEKDKPDLKKT